MADSTNRSEFELTGDALRLHNGPLQCMFAGIMILEAGTDAAIDSAVGVLRQGVEELNEIIGSVNVAAHAVSQNSVVQPSVTQTSLDGGQP